MPGHAPPPAGSGCADHTVPTCLTSGGYSNITRVLPAGISAAAAAGTAELAKAVKRLAAAATRDTPIHPAFTCGRTGGTPLRSEAFTRSF